VNESGQLMGLSSAPSVGRLASSHRSSWLPAQAQAVGQVALPASAQVALQGSGQVALLPGCLGSGQVALV